jgi:tetratricopeptide (TPR) repeat protein
MNTPTATVLARLGVAAIDCGQDDRAVVFFRDALSLRPDMVDAYVGLGTAHFRMDEFAESVKAFRAAVRLNPNAVRGVMRGLVRNSQPEAGPPASYPNMPTKMAEHLRRLDEAEALIRLAAAHLWGGQDRAAVTALEYSIAITYPDETAAVLLIAAYLLLQSRSAGIAIELGEGSVLKEVEPELAAALFNPKTVTRADRLKRLCRWRAVTLHRGHTMEPENPPPEDQTASPSEVWSRLDPERRARVVRRLAELAYRRITALSEDTPGAEGGATSTSAGCGTAAEGDPRLPE